MLKIIGSMDANTHKTAGDADGSTRPGNGESQTGHGSTRHKKAEQKSAEKFSVNPEISRLKEELKTVIGLLADKETWWVTSLFIIKANAPAEKTENE
jgi:hypothetical protein